MATMIIYFVEWTRDNFDFVKIVVLRIRPLLPTERLVTTEAPQDGCSRNRGSDGESDAPMTPTSPT